MERSRWTIKGLNVYPTIYNSNCANQFYIKVSVENILHVQFRERILELSIALYNFLHYCTSWLMSLSVLIFRSGIILNCWNDTWLYVLNTRVSVLGYIENWHSHVFHCLQFLAYLLYPGYETHSGFWYRDLFSNIAGDRIS